MSWRTSVLIPNGTGAFIFVTTCRFEAYPISYLTLALDYSTSDKETEA
jgi:hypothetical protein